MRTLLLACLVPMLASAGPAARKPVIALLPSSSDAPELANLGVLMEARAMEILEASGKYSELHAKQVAAMADAEGMNQMAMSDPAIAAQARAVLGADRVATVVLEKNDKGMNLLGAVYDSGKKPTTFTAKLPAAWPDALVQGSEAIAKAFLTADKAQLPKKATAQPESKSEKALLALGKCYTAVIHQSLGVDSPVTLVGEEIDGAAGECNEALEADDTLRYAQATLALAQAIIGDDQEAAKTLGLLGEAQDVYEPYTLARFWMLTRFQSNEAGIAFLRDTIKKHPSELIMMSYLGDALAATNDHAKAVEAWNEYLALAPQSAFAQGRISRSLARMGKNDEAIAAAKKAVEWAPLSRDAKLQLASRNIDAGKYDDAIAILKPLTEGKDTKGEHLLRYGWASWMKKDVDGAAKLFQAALDKATAPSEWRTRGRALYNLAMVEASRGRNDAATVAYKASLQTGFKVKTVDASLSTIVKGIERSGLAADGGGAAVVAKAPTTPKESSLFPADASGEVDPAAKKPSPPAGLVLYKF